MPNRVPFPPFSQRVFFLFRVAPRGKSDLFRALDRGTSAENCSFIWPGDHSTTRPLHSRHFGGRWKRGREINSERNKEWGREIDTRRRWRASAFWRISVSKLFFSSIRSSRQSFLDVVNARFVLVKSISKITFVFFFYQKAEVDRYPRRIFRSFFIRIRESFFGQKFDRYSFHELCSCTFSTRVGHCFRSNNEAWTIFIEIEVAHATD